MYTDLILLLGSTAALLCLRSAILPKFETSEDPAVRTALILVDASTFALVAVFLFLAFQAWKGTRRKSN